jgi:carboxymethylenebutenolidase
MSDEIGRREFVGLTAAAGIASAASDDVIETDVEIRTPDGVCDAAFIHPTGGRYPGVLIWPDAFGLRPVTRDIGKRLAAKGYSVLVPNPFYRVSKAPFTDASGFNFQNPADMAKLQPLMASVTAPGNAEKDAVAYVAFLDAQKEVNKARKVGTQGYCMGGPLVVRTAATLPDRIGAPALRSMAAAWLPISPRVPICSRPRSRRGCISGSHRMTMSASRTPRTS